MVARVEPGLVSEHLSWSVVGGTYLADLLPLPMTEEALDVVCRNVEQTQNILGRKLLVENPSSYLQSKHSTIPEWQFISAVASRTGCRAAKKRHSWLAGKPGSVGTLSPNADAVRICANINRMGHKYSRRIARRSVTGGECHEIRAP